MLLFSTHHRVTRGKHISTKWNTLYVHYLNITYEVYTKSTKCCIYWQTYADIVLVNAHLCMFRSLFLNEQTYNTQWVRGRLEN